MWHSKWSYHRQRSTFLTSLIVVAVAFCTAMTMASRVWAQDTSSLPGQWVTFGSTDGLPSNEVLVVWTAPNGVAWAGTASGLARFDGMHAWEAVGAGLPVTSGAVRAIWGVSSNDIWVAGDAGLAHFENDGWRQIPAAEMGLPEGPLDAVWGNERGDLWIGGAAGAAHYDGKAWRAFTAQNSRLPNGMVYAIAATAAGQVVWFGTSEGLVRYDAEYDRWSQTALPESAGASILVYSLSLQDEMLFVGTSSGLLRYTPANDQWAHTTGQEWNGPDSVNRMAVADGQIWIAVSPPQFMDADTHLALKQRASGGIRHFDGSQWRTQWLPGGGWEQDPRPTNLVGDEVNSIWLDGQGILWIATQRGLWRYDSERWRAYPEATGEVRDLWSADDGLWVVAEGAIRRFDGKQWQSLTTIGGQPVSRFYHIWSDGQGTAWVGGADGLVRIDGNRWTTYPPETRLGGILDLWGRSTNDVWAVTNDGVAHFDGQTWQLVYENAQATSVIGDGKNGLWLGMENGLFHYDGMQWRDVTTDTLKTATFVTALLQTRDDKTWVGTEQGLYCFGCSNIPMQFEMAPTRALFVSRSGTLWFAAWDKTVDRWDQRLPGTNAVCATGAFSLPPTEMFKRDVRAIGEDKNGDIWFATNEGLLRHQPHRPAVSVKSITTPATGRRTPADEKEVVLPYRHGAITVTLVATNTDGLGLSSEMDFYYMLEGKDTYWTRFDCSPFSPPGNNERMIRYSQLAPGRYQFKYTVYSQNNDSSGIKSQPLTVKDPPPWSSDSPLFPLLLIGAVSASVAVGGSGLRLWQSRRAYGYRDTELVVQAMSADSYRVTWQEPRRTLESYSTQLKHTLVNPYLTELGADQVSETEIRQLGQLLFAALCNEVTRRKLLVATRGGRKGRRLRLNFAGASNLLALPWEFSHGATGLEFLGVHPNTALMRYLPPAEEMGRSKTKWPLEVLVVWAEPSDLPLVGVEEEVNALQTALEPLVENGRLHIRYVSHATLQTFAQAVSDGADIVHFIGHGDLEADRGILYFEDEARSNVAVNDNELAAAFSGFQAFGDKAPKLVVLSACQSGATTSGGTTLAGLAPALLQQGRVPAVVGVQFPIGAQVAASFANHFYHALVSRGGGQVDYAISVARKGLYTELGAARRDWGAPVLYMQVKDGCIFEVR